MISLIEAYQSMTVENETSWVAALLRVNQSAETDMSRIDPFLHEAAIHAVFEVYCAVSFVYGSRAFAIS